MASAQNRKRACADDLSQERSPSKRIKSKAGRREPSNFPPEFWDNLSKIPLTRRALRELDRRNSAQPAPIPATPPVYTKDLARYARHGGPDLRHLRGYLEPTDTVPAMASSRSSASSRRTRATTSTKSATATDASSETKATSAYDDAFEQHVIDYGIYPDGYDYPDGRRTPEPENADRLRQHLSAARPSLSPSQFPDSAFRNFRKKNKTASETTVKRNVIPIIAGNADIPNDGDLPFTNILSITGGRTVKAVPDFFDGARAGEIHHRIRDPEEEGNLNELIVPTKHATAPVAPNFFLETKAPHGGADVAMRQALHDGAIGARAMHALQNYGAEEPAFDGNAYTYSSTYHAGTGTLQLYAHHVTPPTAPGGRPEYHMTQLDGWQMTGNIGTFRQGATAFRNARDLAQRHRDGFIQAANARARQSSAVSPPEAENRVAVAEQDEESADEFVDCDDYPSQPAVSTEDHATPALPQYVYADDEEPSQECASLDAEPATGFATSFATGFTQSQAGSKRTRASSPSPPSNSQPRKKHDRAKERARRSAPRRAAGSSVQGPTSSSGSAAVLLPPASAEEYWRWCDEHMNWFHLNEDGSCLWHDGE